MFSSLSIGNAGSISVKFGKYLNIDSEKIISELEQHPDYPSLLSISDVLSNFSIGNEALRILPEDLTGISCPFAAQTTINNGGFMVVEEMSTNHVWVSNEKWNRQRITSAEFKKIFTGVVLRLKSELPNKKLERKNANKALLSRKTVLLLGLITIFIALVWTGSPGNGYKWDALILIILKTVGLLTSILLLIQGLDNNNPLIKRICQNDTKFNCNAVLSSKAANVTDWLSWSEVGFFYFASTLLLIFTPDSATNFGLIALLNVISLPYTFYSIYYQARIAKKWCILCCIIQGLLYLEFFTILASKDAKEILLLNDFNPLVLICFLLPITFWIAVKPLLATLQEIKPLKDQLRTFKYNQQIFYELLKGSPRYSSPGKEWSIVLGCEEPKHLITIVSNPNCQPCANTHRVVEDILRFRNDVQFRIVFTTTISKTDPRFEVTQHLLALNQDPNKNIVSAALSSWYEVEKTKFHIWAEKYPAEINDQVIETMSRQNAWCRMANIMNTPTIQLNGYLLPDSYQLKDLKYLLALAED